MLTVRPEGGDYAGKHVCLRFGLDESKFHFYNKSPANMTPLKQRGIKSLAGFPVLQSNDFLYGNQFASMLTYLITAVPLAVWSWCHWGHCHWSTMNSSDTWPSSPAIKVDAHSPSTTTFPIFHHLTHTHLNLKALSARSVNNYRQPGRQQCNWMYSELKYVDGQIPINQIHFIAVFLRGCYVQTEPNPPTE